MKMSVQVTASLETFPLAVETLKSDHASIVLNDALIILVFSSFNRL